MLSAISLPVLLLAGHAFSLHAQSQQAAVQEPQYIGQFELLKDGSLTPLEEQKMTYQSKTKNHFISVQTSGKQVVQGASSPIRVASDAHFIVKTSSGFDGIDPNSVIQMKPFLVEKNQRAILENTAKAGMFQGAKGATAADKTIALTFKKYGPNSLEIIPANPLPPGEYLLVANGGAMGVYCFGVDGH